MARIPMVTRTIITTEVTLLVVDLTTSEPTNHTITLPRTYKDEDEILKTIKKQKLMADTNIRPVAVVDTQVKEALYGMPEAHFVEVAKLITKEEAEAESESPATPEAPATPKSNKKSK